MKYSKYADQSLSLESVIRAHVERVVSSHPHRKEAAKLLGVGRTTLYRWLRNWGYRGNTLKEIKRMEETSDDRGKKSLRK